MKSNLSSIEYRIRQLVLLNKKKLPKKILNDSQQKKQFWITFFLSLYYRNFVVMFREIWTLNREAFKWFVTSWNFKFSVSSILFLSLYLSPNDTFFFIYYYFLLFIYFFIYLEILFFIYFNLCFVETELSLSWTNGNMKEKAFFCDLRIPVT